jgi:hypothetical protein
MRLKRLLTAAWAALLPLACTDDGKAPGGGSAAGGAAGTTEPGDDLTFLPVGLPASELEAEGGLTLVASTLVPGPEGPELYAAVHNEGASPACEAGMIVDFKDKAGQVVAAAAGVLVSGRFYRLDGGTGVVISCVAPNQIAMTAMSVPPDRFAIEALGSLEYAFPAFSVPDIVAVEGIDVSDVQAVMTASGYAFTGTVTNAFSETLSAPKVSVFRLNRVGRPLGVATSNTIPDLAAGERKSFGTNSFSRAVAAHAAFASAKYPF